MGKKTKTFKEAVFSLLYKHHVKRKDWDYCIFLLHCGFRTNKGDIYVPCEDDQLAEDWIVVENPREYYKWG